VGGIVELTVGRDVGLVVGSLEGATLGACEGVGATLGEGTTEGSGVGVGSTLGEGSSDGSGDGVADGVTSGVGEAQWSSLMPPLLPCSSQSAPWDGCGSGRQVAVELPRSHSPCPGGLVGGAALTMLAVSMMAAKIIAERPRGQSA
jgi:hypothetical protein